MRFSEMRSIRRSWRPRSAVAQLFAEWRQTNRTPLETAEPWRVHGTVPHCPFKEARRAMERREERHFVRRSKTTFIHAH
jgi:hypothetical protein